MRLIDAQTLRLHEFQSEDAYPPYAILSHTWGTPEQECTFQSMTEPDVSSRIGYAKIKHCCDQALKDGLSWAWVDTCCIDKTSTAELSEAINSMFRWYRKASICYAYIEDANKVDELEKSRWFTRGWTLQELIAPHDVVFFSKSWDHLGGKLELKNVLWHITGIEPVVLESGTLSNVTVAKKMSWAAKRKTTRVEDLAYCLLGIFDVNMPMLYGEGQKSFIRLQEEIMKSSYDHTLFAWSPYPPVRSAEDFIKEDTVSSTSEPKKLYGLLAESPKFFSHSNDIMPLEDDFQSGNNVTSGSGWISIALPTITFRKETQLFAALSCIAGTSYLALPLDTWFTNTWRDFVARRAELVLVQANDLYTPSGERVLKKRLLFKPPILEPTHAPLPLPNVSYIVTITCRIVSAYRMGDVFCSPCATYDKQRRRLTLTPGHTGLHVACLFQPESEHMQAKIGYFLKAAILIGGDVTRDGKLWLAIVPVLPDTGTDEAFHKMCARAPKLARHCTTRSILIDQLASGGDVSVFSKIGCAQVKDWLIGEDHWATIRAHYDRFVYVSARINVAREHATEKVFEITIYSHELGDGAHKDSQRASRFAEGHIYR